MRNLLGLFLLEKLALTMSSAIHLVYMNNVMCVLQLHDVILFSLGLDLIRFNRRLGKACLNLLINHLKNRLLFIHEFLVTLPVIDELANLRKIYYSWKLLRCLLKVSSIANGAYRRDCVWWVPEWVEVLPR